MSITATGLSALNGMPGFRPYRYHGRRVRALEEPWISAAAADELAGGPDISPDYGWRRELLEDIAPDPAPLAPVPAPVITEPPRCEKCGYLITRCSCPGGPRG